MFEGLAGYAILSANGALAERRSTFVPRWSSIPETFSFGGGSDATCHILASLVTTLRLGGLAAQRSRKQGSRISCPDSLTSGRVP